MVDWYQFHPDILSEVIRRITSLSDHIRISGVCSSWRSFEMEYRYTLAHPTPSLMVANSASPHHRQLLCFPENISVYYKLCVPPRDRCCGSYKGWLFLIQEGSNYIYLLNPFIQYSVFLPRLNCPLVAADVYKAVLSSSPSDDPNCIILVLFKKRFIAFCKLEDKSWTILYHGCLFNIDFSDALFFEDRFYVVDDYGKIYTCNLDYLRLEEVFPQLDDVSNVTDKWYLVELRGEIHRVQRISSGNLNFYYEDTNTVEDDCSFGKMGSLISTREFRVWKVDPIEECWIRVEDLSEYALFLGCSNSVAVSELEVSGIKGNRIYFTDDRQRIKHFGFVWPGKDMGIFNLGDSSFEPLCWTQYEWPANPQAVWVAPIPW